MAKSTRKSGKKKNVAKRSVAKPAARKSISMKNLSRRSLAKYVIGAAVLLFGATSLYGYEKNQKKLRDLSVIGAGKPVVVQIYDPSCTTCRRLKKTATIAVKDDPNINFRIADITTTEGKAIQTKYNVPHITLLYIDAKGRHKYTTRGFMTASEIGDTIKQHL